MKHRRAIIGLVFLLVAIVGLELKPYDWRPSAILHLHQMFAQKNPVPTGFVILDAPGYDGEQYWQVARNIPKIVNPSGWAELRSKPPLSYAYQRFLLPAAAFILSSGQDALLPSAFLLINLLALFATAIVVLKWKEHHPVEALALALCPAAMVALHFDLAEPLAILLLTIVLTRLSTKLRIGWVELLCLSLLMLTREVNILFVGFLFVFFLWKKQWKGALLLLIPALVFVLWHWLLYAIFGDIPFLISAGARQIPGSALTQVLAGARGFDRYTISSIALGLGIVIPGLLWSGLEIARTRKLELLTTGTFAFLCLMLLLPDYIWGSITSVGRVITPVYPFLLLACAEKNTRFTRAIVLSTLLIGLLTAIGLALSVHPYHLASMLSPNA